MIGQTRPTFFQMCELRKTCSFQCLKYWLSLSNTACRDEVRVNAFDYTRHWGTNQTDKIIEAVRRATTDKSLTMMICTHSLWGTWKRAASRLSSHWHGCLERVRTLRLASTLASSIVSALEIIIAQRLFQQTSRTQLHCVRDSAIVSRKINAAKSRLILERCKRIDRRYLIFF